jgi:hypothetical protein
MDKGLLVTLAASAVALFTLLLFWAMSRVKRTTPQGDRREGDDGASMLFMPAILGSGSSSSSDCGGSDGGCGGGD